MITDLITGLIDAAQGLLGALPQTFADVFAIVYDGTDFTLFGQVLVAAAGFSLAWAGISFILTYVTKLLTASRGGRR